MKKILVIVITVALIFTLTPVTSQIVSECCGAGSYIAEAATTQLKAPTLKTVSSVGQVTLSWSKVNNAKKYYIYRSNTRNGAYEKVGTTSKLKFTDKDIIVNNTFYYKIKAGGSSAYKTSSFSKSKEVKVSKDPSRKYPEKYVTDGIKYSDFAQAYTGTTNLYYIKNPKTEADHYNNVIYTFLTGDWDYVKWNDSKYIWVTECGSSFAGMGKMGFDFPQMFTMFMNVPPNDEAAFCYDGSKYHVMTKETGEKMSPKTIKNQLIWCYKYVNDLGKELRESGKITENSTEYQIAKAYSDYAVTIPNNTSGSDPDDDWSVVMTVDTAYAWLHNNHGFCASKAAAFSLMMNNEGIKSASVHSGKKNNRAGHIAAYMLLDGIEYVFEYNGATGLIPIVRADAVALNDDISDYLQYYIYHMERKNFGLVYDTRLEGMSSFDKNTLPSKDGKIYTDKMANEWFDSHKLSTQITQMSSPSVEIVSSEENGISIAWQNVLYAKKYYIYRSTTKAGTYSKIGTTSKLEYTDSNVEAGKKYFYKVKAGGYTYLKNSKFSNTVSASIEKYYPAITDETMLNDNAMSGETKAERIPITVKYLRHNKEAEYYLITVDSSYKGNTGTKYQVWYGHGVGFDGTSMTDELKLSTFKNGVEACLRYDAIEFFNSMNDGGFCRVEEVTWSE